MNSIRRVVKSSVAVVAATVALFSAVAPAASAQEAEELTVALTAYGPFSRDHNSSLEVGEKTEKLLEEAGINVVYQPIDTDWNTFSTNLNNLVNEHHPNAIISLGEVKRPAPSVELRAQNLREGGDVNAFNPGGKVDPQGPNEKYAPDENKEAQKATRAAGYSINPSYDAGRYLCNAALYTNLGFLEQGLVEHAAFVHVPVRPAGDAKSAADAEAVAAFIENLVR